MGTNNVRQIADGFPRRAPPETSAIVNGSEPLFESQDDKAIFNPVSMSLIADGNHEDPEVCRGSMHVRCACFQCKVITQVRKKQCQQHAGTYHSLVYRTLTYVLLLQKGECPLAQSQGLIGDICSLLRFPLSL